LTVAETIAVQRARQLAESGETLMSAILSGQASPDDADDWLEAWHDNPHLHEGASVDALFGMTWTEYANWVRDPDAIHEIVEGRRTVNGS
jgi:hypothetical protein